MSACPQCGQENKEGAKFCIKCGAGLEAQVQAEPQAPAAEAVPPPAAAEGQVTPPAEAAPPPPATPPPAIPPAAAVPLVPPPAATPPPQAAQPVYQQPTYQQPAQYQQPTYQQPAYQQPPYQQPAQYQQPYGAPPAAPYPAYAPAPAYATKTRGGMFWVGALIVLVAGIMVLVSTWMAWGSGPGGYLSLSGWDWFDLGKAGGGASGEVVNAFFIYSDGYPIFTGLCSLIVGALIALIAVLMLLFRSKGLGGVAILFSIFAVGMAITNLTTILRTEGISVGVGLYIFLIFSFLGLIGGGLSMSG